MRLPRLLSITMLAACHTGNAAPPPDPAMGASFVDRFDRAELGPDWRNTGGPYRIDDGKLVFSDAHNHPLWLAKRLPHDVQIDFDVTARSPDGDVKVEVFGDGYQHESEDAVRKDLIYEASGYVFIFGGWRNTRSVLVRKNEHAWQSDPSVPQRTSPRVEPGRTYHWTITRRGGHLDWQIDGKPFLAWDDPRPLEGPGQDHFAFDGWESAVAFDNLSISAL